MVTLLESNSDLGAAVIGTLAPVLFIVMYTRQNVLASCPTVLIHAPNGYQQEVSLKRLIISPAPWAL